MFEKVIYTLAAIDGDYGVLKDENGNENRVALALLPDGADEDCLIKWENFEYEIVSQ